jgi:prepilin-type N-terminal cleavage/methylation domain-containing protein
MCDDQRGFTLAEMMVATAIMLVICGAVVSALLQMTNTQRTIFNRTQMHSGVRGATELLQQEVGQAGRISLPAAVTLSSAVAAGAPRTVTVNSTSGMFAGEKLVIGGGASEETVAVITVASATTFTANLTVPHAVGDSVQALGGFSHGIVPANVANGSSATRLKMFGDINGDGNMVYVEYFCDVGAGNLYRTSVAWNAGSKPWPLAPQVLLGNIIANPGGTPCFTYQTVAVDGTTFVINVAITLTVQTQQLDATTKTYQTETKALLNVAPRNIFNVWQLAANDITSRTQPTPLSITSLLPPPPS